MNGEAEVKREAISLTNETGGEWGHVDIRQFYEAEATCEISWHAERRSLMAISSY